MKLSTLTLITLLTSARVFAAPTAEINSVPSLAPVKKVTPPIKPLPLPFRIQTGIYGGTGCPTGSGSLTSDSQGRIVLQTGGLNVNGSDTRSSFSRVSCSVRIPISVSRNYKLIVRDVMNQGQNQVGLNDQVTVSQKLAFVGTPPKANPDLKLSAGSANLNWDNLIGGQYLMESPCSSGRDLMLTLDTNMLLLKRQGSAPTNSFVSLSSSQFQIYAVKCK